MFFRCRTKHFFMCPSLSRILLTCPAQVHVRRPSFDLFSYVCDLCLFSYPDVFWSQYVIISIFDCAAVSSLLIAHISEFPCFGAVLVGIYILRVY